MGGGSMVPPEWEDAADSITSAGGGRPPIVVVCGPGNCGKSTFSRHLLNTLLKRYERVGYLDTDVGQSEFTPPGCLSLHVVDQPAPDLTVVYLKTPVSQSSPKFQVLQVSSLCKRNYETFEMGICREMLSTQSNGFFFFGNVSAKVNPKAYLHNIFRLCDYFRNEYNQIGDIDDSKKPMLPLLVNTSGWVQGNGFKVLVDMLRYIYPTHVVQIHMPAQEKNLPSGMFWLNGCEKGTANLIQLYTPSKDSTISLASMKRDAHTLRDIKLISYFRQCLPRDFVIGSYQELIHGLATLIPFEFPASKIKVVQHHLQGCHKTSDKCRSLHATVVGLAACSLMPSTSENSAPWCIGLGLVKAVDISKGLLYIITPVVASSLRKVDVLLQGSIQIPDCLLQICSTRPDRNL